jgi:hypothetical protein
MSIWISRIIAKLRRFNATSPEAWLPIYDFDPDAAIWIGGVNMAADRWDTVDGRWSLVQADAARRPAVVGNTLRFDGSSDFMTCDELANLGRSDHTWILSCSNVAGTGNRSAISFSKGGATNFLTMVLLSTSVRAHRHTAVGINQSALLDSEAGVIVGGIWRLAFTMDVADVVAKRLAPIPVLISTASTGNGYLAPTRDYFSIGARRISTPAVPALFYQGDIRYVIVGSKKWTDKQIGMAASILQDLGVY